jgi:hypothetical protein
MTRSRALAHPFVASATRQGVQVSRSFRAFACAVVVLCFLAGAPPAHAQDDASSIKEEASFDIWSGSTRLGSEQFRIYTSNDTLIIASSVVLDGTAKDSKLPYEKRTKFLQRAFDSYPLVFQTVENRRDSTQMLALNCLFRDTVAVIYREIDGRGTGESVALPPGRLYILEPGIYLQVQLLVADFLKGSQDERRQPVLIPSAVQVVDLYLKKGPVEAIIVRGKRVDAQRVEITDKLTRLVAWADTDGRMWKLEAPEAGLKVERGPNLSQKTGAAKKPAPASAKKPAKKP